MSTQKNKSTSFPKPKTDSAAHTIPLNQELDSRQRVLLQVQKHLAAGELTAAQRLVQSAMEPSLKNARGVCLLRQGRATEAMRLYRSLVLAGDGTWLRADVPVAWKVNFAISLLQTGLVRGGLDTLHEIGDESYPPIQQLRAAMKKWEQSLSFWQKFWWKLGDVVPNNRPVVFDFPAGVFEVDLIEDSQSAGLPAGSQATIPPSADSQATDSQATASRLITS